MKITEADELAGRIVKTWTRTSIGTDIWTEVLSALGHAAAEAAYRQLRDTETSMPSIALFRSTYREQIAAAPVARQWCDRCGGDGFATSRDGSGLVACTCPAGAERRGMLERIIAANDAELAAHGRGNAGPGATVGPPPRRAPLL